MPDIRFVALKRDCEEVVASFCAWSDHAHSAPSDHWSEQPAAGLFHDPVWSTIFPKYPTASREAGVRRYWQEYYGEVNELQRRFPRNVRVFEMRDVLNTKSGQTALLEFVGIPKAKQVIDISVQTHQAIGQVRAEAGSDQEVSKIDANRRDQCVILVPHGGQIVSGCEDSLNVLEERGYTVRRVPGYSQIDVARNEIASKAVLDGFLETIWIDADIGFHPDAVEKLRAHNLPIVCGIYPKKGKREFAISTLPGTKKITFGNNGGCTKCSTPRRDCCRFGGRCILIFNSG